jgi:nicotinamide-nucleotide amidase
MATAEIVSIGSELLLGQIVDTNAAWMAQRLTELGVNLYFKTVVGDNPDRMREVINKALDRSDIVITGGGIGPTQDDLTRETVARVTGRKLVKDPRLAAQIEHRFRSRGLIMTANNERQAYIPEGSIPVENPNGTAPSFIVEDPRGVVFSLPGVPFEMKWLFDNAVVPYLQERFGLQGTITYRVLKVAEIGESSVDDRIGDLIATSANPTVGVLAYPGQVDVRIAAKAATAEDAARLIAPVETEVRRLLGRHVFGVDDETIEGVVGRLLDDLGVTIASYEDLTGGVLADRLHQASAERFVEGIVSNSPASTLRVLERGREPARAELLLERSGAELADELARAVRYLSGSDYGLALHAVASPDDSAENLAEGNTHVAIADGNHVVNRSYNYGGRGRPDQARMSFNAMELVRTTLLDAR